MSDLLTRIERFLHDERYISATGLVEDCTAEIERLQAVVDAGLAACREVINSPRVPEGERDVAENILRALDGEEEAGPIDMTTFRTVIERMRSAAEGDGEVKP